MIRKIAFLLILLTLPGCGGGCGKVKSWVGLGPSEEEKKKEELQAAQELRKAIEAERERKLAVLQTADDLIQKWTDKLEKEASSNDGFVRPEGLMDLDPWGNQIRIDYSQEWDKEVATVSSAGPDGEFGTKDDLSRTRKATKTSGILSGLPSTVWWIGGWLMCGLLAGFIATGIKEVRTSRGRRGRREHPTMFFVIVLLLGPIPFIIYSFMGIGMVFASIGGSDFDFGGFDFDMDFDI